MPSPKVENVQIFHIPVLQSLLSIITVWNMIGPHHYYGFYCMLIHLQELVFPYTEEEKGNTEWGRIKGFN